MGDDCEVLADLDGEDEEADEGQQSDDEVDDAPVELPHDPSLLRLSAHTEPVRVVAALDGPPRVAESGHQVYAAAAFVGNAARRLFASGGGDDRALLWTADEAGCTAVELEGHTDSVAAVAFRCGGGRLLRRLPPYSPRCSGDGALLATGGLDGKVLLWCVIERSLPRSA